MNNSLQAIIYNSDIFPEIMLYLLQKHMNGSNVIIPILIPTCVIVVSVAVCLHHGQALWRTSQFQNTPASMARERGLLIALTVVWMQEIQQTQPTMCLNKLPMNTMRKKNIMVHGDCDHLSKHCPQKLCSLQAWSLRLRKSKASKLVTAVPSLEIKFNPWQS